MTGDEALGALRQTAHRMPARPPAWQNRTPRNRVRRGAANTAAAPLTRSLQSSKRFGYSSRRAPRRLSHIKNRTRNSANQKVVATVKPTHAPKINGFIFRRPLREGRENIRTSRHRLYEDHGR